MERTLRGTAAATLSAIAACALAGCQSSDSAGASPFSRTGRFSTSQAGGRGGQAAPGGAAPGGATSSTAMPSGAGGGRSSVSAPASPSVSLSVPPSAPAADNRPAPANNWVLSAPDTVLGLDRYQPPASMLQSINANLAKGGAVLGVTGTPVVAVYDDPKYDVYIVFAGFNGHGLDPNRLTTAFTALPKSSDDGAGDRFTHNDVLIDPGDHGGTAGCASELVQSGALAAESTVCTWMTPTTLGSVTYIPKPDNQLMVTGAGPEVMGPVMRSLRNEVENRA